MDEAGEDLSVQHAVGAARQIEVLMARRRSEVVALVVHLGQGVGVRVEHQRAAVQRQGRFGDVSTNHVDIVRASVARSTGEPTAIPRSLTPDSQAAPITAEPSWQAAGRPRLHTGRLL